MTAVPPRSFAHAGRFRPGLPPAVPEWAGFPKYNFIGGHNAPERIPSDVLAAAATRALKQYGPQIALYNLGQGPLGFEPLRDGIAAKLKATRGIDVARESVMVTSGSGQGLDLVNALLLEPGDTAILEERTYAGALNKVRARNVEVVGAPLDDHGIDVDRLGETLENLSRAGKTPKYIYTIPTIQNPTGSILSLERRHRLLGLASHYGVPIFEDECYADLTWSLEAPPALFGLDPSQVIHIGSFSKTLAPALRIGYAVADPTVIRQMAALKNDSGTGALDQMVVAEFLKDGFFPHREGLVAALHDKQQAMLEAVRREFGTTVEIVPPAGGIYIWLKFPDDFDVRRLVEPAAARGVVFNPGPEWSCDGEAARGFMRLCFALPDRKTIEDGVAVLAETCFAVAGFPERSGNVARRP